MLGSCEDPLLRSIWYSWGNINWGGVVWKPIKKPFWLWEDLHSWTISHLISHFWLHHWNRKTIRWLIWHSSMLPVTGSSYYDLFISVILKLYSFNIIQVLSTLHNIQLWINWKLLIPQWGDLDMGQHWPDGTKSLPEPMLTNLQRCSVASLSQDVPMNLICKMCLEITFLKLLPHVCGVTDNELIIHKCRQASL